MIILTSKKKLHLLLISRYRFDPAVHDDQNSLLCLISSKNDNITMIYVQFVA